MMKNNICVCGWYFDNEFYMSMYNMLRRGDIKCHVVANRENPLLNHLHPVISSTVRENVGLEFGAYNEYLCNHWNGGGTVFMHDDVDFFPTMSNDLEVISGVEKIPDFYKTEFDMFYVFNNYEEYAKNHGKHGRMFYLSDRMLGALIATKERRNGMAIWHDLKNTGQTTTGHYNKGIEHFDRDIRSFPGMKLGYILLPSVGFGRRGEVPAEAKCFTI